MSPMYKMTPRNRGPTTTTTTSPWHSNIAADVEYPLAEGRSKMQTIAWLNSAEGKHFLQQFSSVQKSSIHEQNQVKDTSKRWHRESGSPKKAKLVKSSLSSPPKKVGLFLDSPSSDSQRSSHSKSVFNHSPETDHFVRQARLLNRDTSFFPRPVKGSTGSHAIANILRASERRRDEMST
mmetsp:Transcript_7993/g.29749  ORF Transcript_7993/g.29749 Transcript_7993/m.29749 type:complete len:179 (-) Transcript_7993:177-713(-)|eukprot:CAMPEP_0117446838 /NCGR_PEP_ID=MMETSP0759-20121206/6556_1 /TAXON_ID=63605 /ORGANISM="Percolomonas cosmopolitus, Strain WS" /LENGTH=178 /DNA_ID=CAMNT_0005239135 /DNA_START=280 /DNA_END=816 /DNA_ORIENTATION=-